MLIAVIVALVCLLIGLSKGGMGAALAVTATPLLQLIMPAPQAVSFALPLLIFGDIFAVSMFWKRWDLRYVLPPLLPAIAGIIVGTHFLATLPEWTIRHIVAILTLLFIVYKLLEPRLSRFQYRPAGWHGVVAGSSSGLASALANSGGIPFTAYLLLQDTRPAVFVGTINLFFALVNLFKVPPLIVAGLLDLDGVLGLAWALPLIPLGVWLGRWTVQRLDRRVFERYMLAVLFAAALFLLFKQ